MGKQNEYKARVKHRPMFHLGQVNKNGLTGSYFLALLLLFLGHTPV